MELVAVAIDPEPSFTEGDSRAISKRVSVSVRTNEEAVVPLRHVDVTDGVIVHVNGTWGDELTTPTASRFNVQTYRLVVSRRTSGAITEDTHVLQDTVRSINAALVCVICSGRVVAEAH